MNALSPLLNRAGLLPDALRRGTKAYDLFAAVPLIVWYGFTSVSQIAMIASDLARYDFARPDFALTADILAKASATALALLFIVFLFSRRPPIAGARGFAPRIAAIAGAYLSVGILFLPRHDNPVWLNAASTVLILGGVGFSLYALSYLGRAISLLPEARRLVTDGPYALVRHPLYLGEQIAIAGLLMQFFSVPAVLLVIAQFACQFYRMGCEEKVLGEAFAGYAHYKSQTFRLLPGVY